MLAAVSHLPHLLAYALVHDVAKRNNSAQLFSFAAGGFRDFTRIASSHPEMWRDICLANRDRLLQELKLYANELGSIRKLIDTATARGSRSSLPRRATRATSGFTRAEAGAPCRRHGAACRARRASRTASCCSPRWPGARPRCCGLLDADDTRVMRDALAQLWRSDSHGQTVTGVGRSVPGQEGRSVPRQRRHGVPSADRGARVLRRRIPPLRRAAHARAADRRPGRCAARHRRSRRLHRARRASRRSTIHPGKICRWRSCACAATSRSQFLTALLMALPLSGKPARIEVQGELISKPYVEITLNVMKRFGIEVQRTGWRYFDVPAGTYRFSRENLRRGRRFVGVVLPRRRRDRRRAGARRRRRPRHSIQGDVRFTEVLERMGATRCRSGETGSRSTRGGQR